jgi:hypothetical protein
MGVYGLEYRVFRNAACQREEGSMGVKGLGCRAVRNTARHVSVRGHVIHCEKCSTSRHREGFTSFIVRGSHHCEGFISHVIVSLRHCEGFISLRHVIVRGSSAPPNLSACVMQRGRVLWTRPLPQKATHID